MPVSLALHWPCVADNTYDLHHPDAALQYGTGTFVLHFLHGWHMGHYCTSCMNCLVHLSNILARLR